jgi:hypothetical protein
MYYDSRFYTPSDAFHSFYEFAVLVVLATAVLHIRPVSILSNPADNVDMFTFALSITIANMLAAGRVIEVMLFVKGQEVAKVSARRDLIFSLFMLIFNIAATIVSGLEFFNNDDDHTDYGYDADKNSTAQYDDDHHRFMAAAESTSYAASDHNDIPIWLMIGGAMSNVFSMALMIMLLPGGGKHKEYEQVSNNRVLIVRSTSYFHCLVSSSASQCQ